MYIQEKEEERSTRAPLDYSGHTYRVQEDKAKECEEKQEQKADVSEPLAEPETSAAAPTFAQKGGKRCGILENLGGGGLLSRLPFLSSFLPPPREKCEKERHHGEWWDVALLALAVLCLLGDRENDVLPILLLLLLWD